MTHLLDRPVWNALNGGWAALAEANGTALRLRPDYGPFGAAAGLPDEWITTLIPSSGELWLVEREPQPAPPGTQVLRRAALSQMVAETVRPKMLQADAVPLGDADTAEMQALAALCRPGPFTTNTHRLGRFVGVRDQGRLIAMAGERMRMSGYTEVSGVCTHPHHAGRGLAGGLMSLVAAAIVARRETPFLHCYPDNRGAVALYERLGFRLRATVMLTVLVRA